ncbi:MAG TPA: shikimate kinase [Gammaproteobacteria bacterium]
MHNLILIGPMGAGKTSIGRRLAELLALPFRDTDQEIRERAGVEIDFIFEKEGEAGFRRREKAVFADIISEHAVIATGGGIVLDQGNRERMKESGNVVFLETSVDWQLARTRRGRHRPLLDTPDPLAVLARMHAIREPLYRECATVTVSTDGRHVAAVANAVLDALRTAGIHT